MNCLIQLWHKLVDFIYPPHCLVCNSFCQTAPKNPAAWDSSLLCRDCSIMLSQNAITYPWPGRVPEAVEEIPCRCCGENNTLHTVSPPLCLVCASSSMPLSAIRSVFLYRGKTTQLIKRFKYHSQRLLGRNIGCCLALAAQGRICGLPPFPTADWDLIAAVPSSVDVLRRRGFFHLGQIIFEMRKRLNIPADVFALRSCKIRPTQAGLAMRDRLKNMSRAFSASPSRVFGKRILLVDDVITTGASLWAAAEELKKAGARRVDALTFARSPRFQINRLNLALSQHE